MVLHELCDAINRSGHRASIVFAHGGSAVKQDFQYGYSNNKDLYDPDKSYFELDDSDPQKQIAEILDSGTVIYPDLIVGNPLGGRRIIRFILNRNLNINANEYILTYSKVYCDNYHFALPKMFLDCSIHNHPGVHWSHRNLDLTYIGKGAGFTDCFRIPGTILVERDWPRDKEQLGLLLRQCRFFFTWDCVSATNYDAALCGAVPVLMHDKQIPRREVDQMEFGGFPDFDSQLNELRKGVVKKFNDVEIKSIDTGLHKMQQNILMLEDSWVARVGQFLNNYIIYMNS